MRRAVLLAVAVLLVAIGTMLLGFPFQTSLDGHAGELPLRLKCRPPLIAAWNRGEKGQLAVWAVTTNDDAYAEVREGDVGPYCAAPARKRFALGAAAFVAGSILVLVMIRRARHRPALK